MTTTLGADTRERLVALFDQKIVARLDEQQELRFQISEHDNHPGDECDCADMQIQYSRVCFRISILNEDVARLRAVVKMLREGWDALCIDCGDTVLPRLEAGHATRRCRSCKDQRERKSKGTRTFARFSLI